MDFATDTFMWFKCVTSVILSVWRCRQHNACFHLRIQILLKVVKKTITFFLFIDIFLFSSAIKGFTHNKIAPSNVCGPSMMVSEVVKSDIIFTAETHNMPTAVAPFSGATTGTGGRLRDVQAVGRGGHTVAGTAGYCVGNLNIPGNINCSFHKTENMASCIIFRQFNRYLEVP